MIVTVDGVAAHAATGGVHSNANGPVVILIHGAGNDATVWQLQTRYLAGRGIRAFAIDLPGHGKSEGAPLSSIESMAAWLERFVVAAQLGPAHLVGHSMGSVIALEFASRFPGIARSLTLCGTAATMPVHPALIEGAADDLPAAAALMSAWSHGRAAHIGLNPTPGLWMLGGARALVERSHPGVLTADFGACVAYDNAQSAAQSVTCPATVVIGLEDKMTPPQGGRTVASWLPNVRICELRSTGHMMMNENPRAVRAEIVRSVNQWEPVTT